jgi:hypothetical protein
MEKREGKLSKFKYNPKYNQKNILFLKILKQKSLNIFQDISFMHINKLELDFNIDNYLCSISGLLSKGL